MCRISAEIGPKYGTNRRSRNLYSKFACRISVCANLVFAAPRLRFSGLEPPTSRFFFSRMGCFFMPTPASPRFELLQRCRPLQHAFPFRSHRHHEQQHPWKLQHQQHDQFPYAGHYRFFLSKNAFDTGNSSKHHRRDNSVLICVVFLVCRFCWNFVLVAKRRIRPHDRAVNRTNGPHWKQEKCTHKTPKRQTKRLKDSRDMHSTFGTDRGVYFYTTNTQYANPSHFRAMHTSRRHFEIQHTKRYDTRYFFSLLITFDVNGWKAALAGSGRGTVIGPNNIHRSVSKIQL